MSLSETVQLRELTFVMALPNERDLQLLEAALPKTRIVALTGGGTVGGLLPGGLFQ